MSAPKQEFSTVVEPHLSLLYRTAWRLCRNRSDAEDLVQEVCLRACRALQQGQEIAAPRAWLLRIQYRLHVDFERRSALRRTETYDDTVSGEAHPNVVNLPEASAALEQQVDALSQAWRLLSSDQQALLACYAEGHTLNEIVSISGLPLTAVKARMRRARLRLGKLMSGNATDADRLAAGERK